LSSSPAVTIALALGMGSLLSVAADRWRFSAPLLLLAAGLLLGRSGVGVIDTASLGPLLTPIITLGIGLLVYEGALHLTLRELRRAPRAVGGLLTTGVLVTWALAAIAAAICLEFDWPASILLGAMLTVTGPTVVQPILRRLRVTPRLRTALSAEAVLIDPIGVLLTIVVLTLLKGAAITPVSATMLFEGARHLGFQVLTGIAVGLGVGLASLFVARMLSVGGRTNPRQLNLLAVGSCMAAIGLGGLNTAEAGLVAAVVAAVCLGSLRSIGIADLHSFKQQLASVTVAALFMLLAARFDLRDLAGTGWGEVLFVAALIFIVRPLSAGTAMLGSHMESKERWFIASFAPRGIVALSVAVIAAQDLAEFANAPVPASISNTMIDLGRLVRDSASLERIMFIVIAATVLWASAVGPLLARLLRVGGTRPSGLLLVGGHRVSLETARVLHRLGVDITLLDSHYEHVLRAEAASIPNLRGDATDLRWLEDQECCEDLGMLLAWTGNSDVDFTVARWASERLGQKQAAIWATGQMPTNAAWTELGGGRLLHEILDEVESGAWRVASWQTPEASSIPFMAVEDHRARFLVPGEPVPAVEVGGVVTLVGLIRA